MKKISKIVLSVFFISLFCLIPLKAHATNNLNIYLFWGDGCPHCAKEKAYLAEVLPNYPNVKLNKYEIYNSQENVKLMQKAADKLNVKSSGVPFLIIGDKEIIGYAEGITGQEIESRIKYCSENTCPDSIAQIVNPDETSTSNASKEQPKANTDVKKVEKVVDLPFIGKINTANFSLPALAVIIGAIDGFNPCSMWVLMFLISLLLGMKSRKRMWALGGTFIVASAAVYFLFMAAWLQLILFLGFIAWVRIAIGLIALSIGGYHLYDYIKNRKNGVGCKVTGNEKRKLVFEKLKNIAHQNSLWMALGGIILLAFAVNLVELVCSAGFPAIFTQVLSLSNLPTWQYYAYILLYIFFFMLDDIIIFAIAMFTLKVTGVSTKYTKLSKVVGGILMIVIGAILVFKPELLMFG